MSKYIDADALKNDLYSIIKADYGYTADVLAGLMIAERAIDNAPTADVVDVRCKDCKYYEQAKVNNKGFLICPASGMEITEADYCSYGEREETK